MGEQNGSWSVDPHALHRRAEQVLATIPDDGRPTEDRIAEAVEVAQAELTPTAKVAAIRRAMFEDAQDTRDTDGPAREEVPGTAGLLHRRVAAVLFGERGCGKSTVAVILGLSSAAAGERVLYLDRENGAALTADRIEGALDAHEDWPDLLHSEAFVGRHYPELDPTWEPEDFGEAIAGEGFTVAILDSVREMLAQLGLDPDRETDVSRFFNLAVTPLLRRGLCVVLLDNVGHRETHRPKGSATKLDAAPQAFKITTTGPFSPVLPGRINIVCSRSRFGDLDREWSMRVGGELFEVPVSRTETPDARRTRERDEMREEFRRMVVAVLREREPLGREALVRATRERGVRGRSDKLRGWLAELAADPISGVRRDGDEGFGLDRGHDPENRGHSGVTPSAGGMTPDPPIGVGVTPYPADRGHPGVTLPDEDAILDATPVAG